MSDGRNLGLCGVSTSSTMSFRKISEIINNNTMNYKDNVKKYLKNNPDVLNEIILELRHEKINKLLWK